MQDAILEFREYQDATSVNLRENTVVIYNCTILEPNLVNLLRGVAATKHCEFVRELCGLFIQINMYM